MEEPYGIGGLRVEADRQTRVWTQLAHISRLIISTSIDVSELFLGSKLKVDEQQGFFVLTWARQN